MRPLRLDLAGFTVFREPAAVDLTDADFFALVGPTGSGKSTVLDAICFALYGTVPRWGDRRAIANALAPSANQARVRLVFESAGLRYAATRVLRRDAKGKVTTSHAGLELLPKGFDLSSLDTKTGTWPELTGLGEALAGTPGELDAAVAEVVGLPYEQFTTCVVLPQGAFAEFLHAKPAARQQILVNLLGLSVYEKVREEAAALATRAEARVSTADGLLDGLADASDEALHKAGERVAAMRRLAEQVAAAVPDLISAGERAQAAQAALADLDGELALLRRVTADRSALGAAEQIAEAMLRAQETAACGTAAVTTAEEREEKLRTELLAAGDPAELRRMLDEYAELDRLTAQTSGFASAVGAAEEEHEAAVRALDAASRRVALAGEVLAAAERDVEAARTADRAATLRPHLRLGDPCPVCEQRVAVLPATPRSPALAAANARLDAARADVADAQRAAGERDRAARHLDRALAAVRAQRDQLTQRAEQLRTRLSRTVDRDSVRVNLDAVGVLQRNLDDAALAVRAAREAARQAATAAVQAQQRERAAWRDFDRVRDALAPIGPPPADRDNLGAAWRRLAIWATSGVEMRAGRRAELAAALDAARFAAQVAGERLAELFIGAGLDTSADPGESTRAAAVAVERAQAAHARLVERREQAETLRAQRAADEREAQVARALSGHLRANNFERWLLAEALDLLVDGASRILRELSAGQYELVHDKGEFFVVDHHDAALRRAVRTLSGGETFQASLALALALSEQLAGLSTGAASLESILLDEGFGTLDAASLDTVAATLENLAARGDRMVGVVTHVDALAERIPVRLRVSKDARSARVERL
jgi:exonuclease SbcC